MQFVRQGSTEKVVLGPFVDEGDGKTMETGVDVSTADEASGRLSDESVIDFSGYTWAAIAGQDGYFNLTLQSDLSDTVGHVTLNVADVSLCLPVKKEYTVLEEAVYDQLFAASAAGAATVAALAALSTKQDSDMVIVATAHTKTQSDILLGATVIALSSLSTKQDSDMVILATDHDKTQSDILLLSGKADSDMVLLVADHDKTQSDIVLLSDKADSDMVLVLADHDKTQSDVALAQVDLDTLTGSISELSQAAPTATPTLLTAVMLLYMMARNKFVTQTSGADALEFYNNAGTKVFKKLITDDGSDYTEAEMTSGA